MKLFPKSNKDLKKELKRQEAKIKEQRKEIKRNEELIKKKKTQISKELNKN